jgi:hypothetical protein
VRNCEVGGPAQRLRLFKRPLASSGISWEAVDGGTVENILVTNVNILRTESPIFLCIGDHGRVLPGILSDGPRAAYVAKGAP